MQTMDSRIQIKFVSSTTVNFENEVSYYVMQVETNDNISCPVQDPTISSTGNEDSIENEELAPNNQINQEEDDEQNRLIREMEILMMEAAALMAELV